MTLWTRLPLRTQLTAVFSVLLLVGLGLTGLAAHALLEQLDPKMPQEAAE